MVEDRGKGVEGDQSVPSSPEAVMSVRSGRSGGGRGTKRRREESTAISISDAGTEEEGTRPPPRTEILIIELTSPTAVTRQKRPRNATTQRKASASVTPAASTAPKRRGRWPKKEEKEEKEESEEDEAEETESLDTASVADTDGGPVKGLRTSSRRRGAGDEKSETSASGRGSGRGRGRGRGGRGRGRGRGH
jgi:hypothetical protein